VAALDWFATDVAAPPVRRPRSREEARPRARPRRRAQGLRVSGGIFWISAFALLLAGVVAINVAVLRVNMSVGDLNKQQLELQNQNQTLSSEVSSAGSSLLIERTARRLGLVPAPAADTSYLDLGGK
jgi:cell division protein FtsL